jgi:hypothetical protein
MRGKQDKMGKEKEGKEHEVKEKEGKRKGGKKKRRGKIWVVCSTNKDINGSICWG